jgi:rare lipoprotein A (peptidoglycan hydrolase)
MGRVLEFKRGPVTAKAWPFPPHRINPPRICPNLPLGFTLPLIQYSWRRFVSDSSSRIMIVTALAVSLSACSVSKRSHPADETQTLSPRVVKVGDPIPKGGGVYKLGEPYLAGGKWFVPIADTSYDRVGLASWYGDFFHGRQTANGEVYDMNALTGAHPTLPLPTYVSVTNLSNNRTVVVRINDRGPYHDGRIIDLSHKAAELLGFFGHGTAPVRVRYLGPAPLNGDDSFERSVLARQPWATHVVSNVKPQPSPATHLLAAAVVTAERPLVIKKSSFEGHRNAEAGWTVSAQPLAGSYASFAPIR